MNNKSSSSFNNSNDVFAKAEAITCIMNLIKEKELTKTVAEENIEILKEMIMVARKSSTQASSFNTPRQRPMMKRLLSRKVRVPVENKEAMNSQTFMRMRKVQWLESQRSKAIDDINELSDLVVELCSDSFSKHVNYRQRTQAIVDKPAVRSPETERKASYKELETLLLTTINSNPLAVPI
jgi:hypothetical protein